MAIFKPYKVEDNQLSSLPVTEGQFIVTTDTKKIYLDKDSSNRIEIAGTEINDNLVNGSATGSLRGIGTLVENDNYTIGDYAFVEGQDSKAEGYGAHAEGIQTTAGNTATHAEGYGAKAIGARSHAEGYYSQANGANGHAEGASTRADGSHSHAEGNSTKALDYATHAEGSYSIALCGEGAHAEGYGDTNTSFGSAIISSKNSNVLGLTTEPDLTLIGCYVSLTSTADYGYNRLVTTINQEDDEITLSSDTDMSVFSVGNTIYFFKRGNVASARGAHAEGNDTLAANFGSHAEGYNTIAKGWAAHAEGYSTIAQGQASHTEGYNTEASGAYSHAEGRSTTASNEYAHAEGRSSTASGKYGHAEGYYTTASDYAAHAEGSGTVASGQKSHAEGEYTIAASDYQHVQGRYNISESNETYLDIIGNGTADNARSNAATVDWSGNAWYAGDVYVGSTSGTNKDSGSKKLLKEGDAITGVSVNGTSIATSGVANITSVPASILTGAIPSAVTATTQTQGDNSTKIATTAYVDTAIDNLPEPMVFKGSLGTGGTITALPVDGSANIGDTYKVITDGTYASKTAKVGDTFICLTKTSNANTWELIPSGDEPSGTVTSVTLNATGPIAIDSSAAITTSGSRTISHATSGVTAGTYTSVTVNDTGHVTAGTNPTTLAGYGITDASISSQTITLGSNSVTVPTKTSELTNDANFMSGMTILKYGSSTWNDFLTAYTAKHVVYTRASSNSNPATGSQTRLAFMAYVNDETNPTNVEFQYYRSVSSHSNNQQGDQTYVYKLDKTAGWTVTVRENYTKVVGSDGITGTWSSGVLTLKHDTSGVTAGTYNSVTVDAKGHVTAGTNPTTLSGYGITDAKIENGTITLGSNTITPLTSSSTLDATQLSGAIPSSVTATTQTSTDNSTKIATTAFVQTAVSNVTVENASSTVAGVLKVRLDDNTNTLYITNNGQDA